MSRRCLAPWACASLFALLGGCHSYVVGPAPHAEDGPAVFDLGLKPEHFAGRLPEAPEKASCHSQGLAIAGDRVVLSCCMFVSRGTRAEAARSLLLSAPLAAIEAGVEDVPWTITDITAPAPTIADAQLGHPSGLLYDGTSVWVANAVYAPNTESVIQQHDPVTLQAVGRAPMVVSDHIGTLAGFGETVVGFNWDSERAYVWQSGEPAGEPVALSGGAYQDCVGMGESVACGYVRVGKARMDILTPELNVERTESLPRLRASRYPLTHEGMGISSDGRYLYFLPDDLPKGHLIRVPTRGREPARSAPVIHPEPASAPSAS